MYDMGGWWIRSDEAGIKPRRLLNKSENIE
jgi:hypothetical protein